MRSLHQVGARAVLVATATAVVLSGCATASNSIATAYVSPLQYSNYDCQQIIAEQQRLHVRVNQIAGRLDQAASNDKALVGVGMILFWPALFALGGTKEQEAEYARLKGEYEALQKVAVDKRCGMPAAEAAAPPAAASRPAAAAQAAVPAVTPADTAASAPSPAPATPDAPASAAAS